jgi:hypothetical protein
MQIPGPQHIGEIQIMASSVLISLCPGPGQLWNSPLYLGYLTKACLTLLYEDSSYKVMTWLRQDIPCLQKHPTLSSKHSLVHVPS